MEFKRNTQKGIILEVMGFNSKRWFYAYEFMRPNDVIPFVGYKAPTRISELQKKGYVESKWGDQKTGFGRLLKQYRLKQGYKVITGDKGIEIERVDN